MSGSHMRLSLLRRFTFVSSNAEPSNTRDWEVNALKSTVTDSLRWEAVYDVRLWTQLNILWWPLVPRDNWVVKSASAADTCACPSWRIIRFHSTESTSLCACFISNCRGKKKICSKRNLLFQRLISFLSNSNTHFLSGYRVIWISQTWNMTHLVRCIQACVVHYDKEHQRFTRVKRSLNIYLSSILLLPI